MWRSFRHLPDWTTHAPPAQHEQWHIVASLRRLAASTRASDGVLAPCESTGPSAMSPPNAERAARRSCSIWPRSRDPVGGKTERTGWTTIGARMSAGRSAGASSGHLFALLTPVPRAYGGGFRRRANVASPLCDDLWAHHASDKTRTALASDLLVSSISDRR